MRRIGTIGIRSSDYRPPRLDRRRAFEIPSFDDAPSEGEAVSVVPSFSLNEYGLYGDLANVPASAVVHHPATLSWVEAAAVWMQYMDGPDRQQTLHKY